MNIVKAKVSAKAAVELIITFREHYNGGVELEEVLEILDIDDIDDIEIKSIL